MNSGRRCGSGNQKVREMSSIVGGPWIEVPNGTRVRHLSLPLCWCQEWQFMVHLWSRKRAQTFVQCSGGLVTPSGELTAERGGVLELQLDRLACGCLAYYRIPVWKCFRWLLDSFSNHKENPHPREKCCEAVFPERLSGVLAKKNPKCWGQ